MTEPITTLNDAAAGSPWDAIVIGAGPGGAFAARELASRGASVLLVERSRFPRDKVCGACLNGQALAILQSAGLSKLGEDLGGIPLNTFHLGHARRSTRLRLPGGMAVSRSRLDSSLVDAATEAGVCFLPETRALVNPTPPDSREPIRRVTLKHQGREIHAIARVVVVASGLGANSLSLDPSFRTLASKGSRVGAGCHVESFPDSYEPGTIFMAVGTHGYVGLTRVEDGSLNVAAAFDKPFLAECGSPELASATVLDEAGFPSIPALSTAPWKGTMSLTRRVRPLADNRAFLIGDSCGYVEPFTGEGMGWALQSANLVVPLIMRGIELWEDSLNTEWESLYQKKIGRQQRLCRGLASILRHRWLMRGAFELATFAPTTAHLIIDRMNSGPHLSLTRPLT